MTFPRILTITDDTGHTWTMFSATEEGELHYTDLKDGTFLVCGRIKTPPVNFVYGEETV